MTDTLYIGVGASTVGLGTISFLPSIMILYHMYDKNPPRFIRGNTWLIVLSSLIRIGHGIVWLVQPGLNENKPVLHEV